nr:hypothetical protein [Microcystis sp. M135S2]
MKVVSLILPVQSKLKEDPQGGKSSDRFWNLPDLVTVEVEGLQGGESSDRFWNLPDLVTVEVEVLQGGELSDRFSWLFVGFP